MGIKSILKGIKIKVNFDLFRKVSTAEAQKVAEKEGLKYFEISAKTGENISKMIYSAIADLSFFEQFDTKDKNNIIYELG